MSINTLERRIARSSSETLKTGAFSEHPDSSGEVISPRRQPAEGTRSPRLPRALNGSPARPVTRAEQTHSFAFVRITERLDRNRFPILPVVRFHPNGSSHPLRKPEAIPGLFLEEWL